MKKIFHSRKTSESQSVKTKRELGFLKPFRAIGRYFKGAWVELKQVRWPDTKATWSMTLAVILFSAFFIVLIVFLDSIFSYLVKFIIN